ncbi:hypothetical protein QBC35DRAFT_75089 [Podospora australis]|uniref:Uncharacterized protein n=1 Tax=Podospora australis TaxID=1536484 RepID=A0AAN6WYJ6_9PEZI|nr:hypothetical protein QBC35DRAFT_75089 [Podospora australis]
MGGPTYHHQTEFAVELDGKPIYRALSAGPGVKTHNHNTERGKLLKSDQWRAFPSPEGLYQVCISEVLDNGAIIPLESGGGRAWVVTAVLDLGLRMMESSRGRGALGNLARKAITVWRERPVQSSSNSSPSLSSEAGSSSSYGHFDKPTFQARKEIDTAVAVDDFLRCVRYQFPLVKLDGRNGFLHEAETTRLFSYWNEDFFSPQVEELRFNPKQAAVLHLNAQLVDKLYWARLKADVARRHRRQDDSEQMQHTTRFRRLQFHLAAMVTHHLCHLFVNFLKGFDGLEGEVSDGDFMRLVTRYDPGAEFEVEFFGGRPKLFIDHPRGPEDEKYTGKSFVIKRGENGRRMAASVATYKLESYLQGDFSVPLLTEVEGEVFPMEKYQDLKRRYGESKLTSCHYSKESPDGRNHSLRPSPEIGSSGASTPDTQHSPPLGMPWNVKGPEYQLLKQASFDVAARVAQPMRVKTTYI